MQARAADWLTHLLFRADRPSRPIIALVVALAVSPVAVAALLSVLTTADNLRELALSRRQSVVFLASATVRADLDRLRDIGISLATRVRFRELVAQGRWSEAIRILEGLPRSFPFIDRLFLTDRGGTLMADTPGLPGVIGKNFAYRDWYQGVSRSWQPYISEIYRRAAEPRLNVFATAVPIRDEADAVVGILVMQTPVNLVLEWAGEAQVGPGAELYVVDRKGHRAVLTPPPDDSAILDLAGLEPITRALRGERGIAILPAPGGGGKRVFAYGPVPEHGWAVISEQPAALAFAARRLALRNLSCAYLLLLIFSAGLSATVLRALIQRKKAEDRIQELNETLSRRALQLDAANRELESFSYSVSHDLRAPLRSIDGFSRAILEECAGRLDGRAQGHLERVRGAALRMGQLIDDLLSLSRLTRAEMRRQRVDLSDLARRLAEDLRRSEPARRVEITVQEGLAAEGDARLLRIALENLLRNAWKFTGRRAEPRIEVGAVRENGGPAFFVRDNGAGFDMAYVHKLFGAFQRLHAASEFEGTGIGLATVARVVHRHGGRVWAEGAVDQGATFYFTL